MLTTMMASHPTPTSNSQAIQCVKTAMAATAVAVAPGAQDMTHLEPSSMFFFFFFFFFKKKIIKVTFILGSFNILKQ